MENRKTLCYPVRKKVISTDDSCISEKWELLEKVGEKGTYGDVWSVCCKTDCNHVLKFLAYDNGNSYEDIIKEIEIQNKCSHLNLCPKIQDAWLCDQGGAIVMDLYEMTIEQLLFKYTALEDRIFIIRKVLELVEKLHSHGIYHGDLHLNNIMVEKLDPFENTLDNYLFYFIDFGKGYYILGDSSKIINDYSDIGAHLQDLMDEYPSDHSFEQLYKIVSEKMKKY